MAATEAQVRHRLLPAQQLPTPVVAVAVVLHKTDIPVAQEARAVVELAVAHQQEQTALLIPVAVVVAVTLRDNLMRVATLAVQALLSFRYLRQAIRAPQQVHLQLLLAAQIQY